ncbi:unnamed protein product [Calypogeia fissa]
MVQCFLARSPHCVVFVACPSCTIQKHFEEDQGSFNPSSSQLGARSNHGIHGIRCSAEIRSIYGEVEGETKGVAPKGVHVGEEL